MNGLDIRITDYAELDCGVEEFDWRFARERAGEIATHWRALVAARPKLFDGRVFLMHGADASDGRILRTTYFETAFSAFIAWRDFGFPDLGVRNGFSMAALRGSDGAFVLARMGEHTANPGKIYFPAGTPDLSDYADGKLDLSASVARELEEETGLSAREARMAPGWTVVDAGPRLACMKIVEVDAPAAELARDLDARIAAQKSPELARMVVARDERDLDPARMPDFIMAYLRAMFAARA